MPFDRELKALSAPLLVVLLSLFLSQSNRRFRTFSCTKASLSPQLLIRLSGLRYLTGGTEIEGHLTDPERLAS